MATMPKLMVLFSAVLVFAFVLGGVVNADEGVHVVDESRSDGADSPYLVAEIEKLKSKIKLLETNLDESSKKLKNKDDALTKLEKDIKEKSGAVASLQGKIESLQKKGSSDAEERASKANALAADLQKQVDQLTKEIELQNSEKDALGARANEAEKKIMELDSKVKDLQKINDDQKSRIRKTERALRVAEEEMIKAKSEASTKIRELTEVHGAWLPPWLAEHALKFESLMITEWNEHGKPVVEIVVQKTKEAKVHTEKWAEPHIETIKTKWLPTMKEQWLLTVEYLEPQWQSFSSKAMETYETSKSAIKPHIVKVQEVADPYYQEIKKFSKPYVEQVAIVAKPHVEKARGALKPYTEKAVVAYRKFLESATIYHQQVQTTVHEKMKNNELTKHLATKELVWFVASALLALPVMILFRFCSAMFFKKPEHARHGHSHHHGRRKHKRGHSEK